MDYSVSRKLFEGSNAESKRRKECLVPSVLEIELERDENVSERWK